MPSGSISLASTALRFSHSRLIATAWLNARVRRLVRLTTACRYYRRAVPRRSSSAAAPLALDWSSLIPAAMSVLSAIRACVVSGHRGRVSGDMVELSPGVSLSRKAASAWRYRKDDFLTADSILFFLHNERLKLSEYVKACNAEGVQVIPFGERKALLEYVRGERDNNTYIDWEKESQQQQQGGAQAAQSRQGQAAGADGGLTQPSASAAASVGSQGSSTSLQPSLRKRAHSSIADDGVAGSTAAGGSAAADDSHASNGTAAASAPSSSLSTGSSAALPASLRPPSSWQLADCVAEERVYLTRVSCLQANNNFSAVLAAWDEAQSRRAQKERHSSAAAAAAAESEEQRRKAAKQSHRPTSAFASASASSSRNSGSRPPASRSSHSVAPTPSSSSAAVPIILVPSSLSSCLTLYNARDFLDAGRLLPTAEARTAMAGAPKPAFLRLQRPSCLDAQRVVSFDVMDDVSLLRSADDWRRVVAVFVSGSAWQFDGWPAPYTSPAAIATHMAAFYMHYSDEQANKNVAQWRVHRLTAHRDKHHHDRSLQLDFWNTLTEQLKCSSRAHKLNV